MTQSLDEDVKRVVVMFPALAVKVIGVLVSILVLWWLDLARDDLRAGEGPRSAAEGHHERDG